MGTPEHDFTPIVTVTAREDGRYAVTFDWSDSYLGVMDEESGVRDDTRPDGGDVCAAMDEWVRSLPGSFIIPGYSGEGE